jgi:hypothetical protein
MTHSIAYRRMLNKMGYYNYQSGLIYRHLNQEEGWNDHLKNCRSFILKAVDYYKPDKVSVLGSGWLLDLPLAEVLEKTSKICLIDIVHPPEVVSQAGKLKNVELIELDVSGGLIEEVWKKCGKYSFFSKLQSLADIVIPEFTPGTDPGMVISLNIITQLESLLVDFIRKRSGIAEQDLILFRTGIQKKHVDFLKKYNSVLISDTNEVITDNKGNVKTVPTLLTDIPSGRFREEWTWKFDLKGTDFHNRRSVMNVVAVTI